MILKASYTSHTFYLDLSIIDIKRDADN